MIFKYFRSPWGNFSYENLDELKGKLILESIRNSNAGLKLSLADVDYNISDSMITEGYLSSILRALLLCNNVSPTID